MKNSIVFNFRRLRRERLFTVINILGLSLGMFCFILTSLYVADELTHDKWHKNAEYIYTPKQSFETASGTMNLMAPFALSKALVEANPGVLDAVNISSKQKVNYSVKGEDFVANNVFNTTDALFRVFDFELSLGNQSNALSQPDGIIISNELAKKHFPDQNPMGELFELEGQGSYKVTGVLKPIPSNSHLQFDLLIPIDFTKGLYINIENNWQFGMGLQYLLVDKNYDLNQLSKEVGELVQKNKGEATENEYSFDRFSELYLTGSTSRRSEAIFGGQERYIIIFSVVGTLMLLVAAFNYINMTTSRSFSRSKDFAIRKVIGASKLKLITIQLGETFIVSVIALLIAIIGIELALPVFNEMIGKRLSLSMSNNLYTTLVPVSVLFIIMLLTGLYPAIIGSKFNLSRSLKGVLPNSKGSIIRKGLIVLQFTICIGVLASALIIRFQANHMINMDLGYNAKNIISIEMRKGGMYDQKEIFRNELKRSTLIEQVSAGPVPSTGSIMFMEWGEGTEKRKEAFALGYATKGFVDIAGLRLMAGEAFQKIPESGLEDAVIINETAARSLDYAPEEAVGKLINSDRFRVIGVVEDFHVNSTKSKIRPMIIFHRPDNVPNTLVRYKAGNQDQVMSYVESVWSDMGATEDISFKVIENHFDNAFKREEALVSIFDGLTIMLIMISCLGLFSLAVFESQIREKELCIRKVLGANAFRVLKSLNQNFVILISLSILISVPITRLLINGWLTGFPYRIDSTVIYFVVSSGFVLFLAVLMLVIQGMNSVRKNPADVLRNE